MRKIALLAFLAFCSLQSTAVVKSNHKDFPEFSWDKVPVCVHVSKGDGTEDFTKAEIEAMVKHPFIVLEKNQGFKLHGSVEKGTLVAAKAIKAVNPNVKVLYYKNTVKDYGRFSSDGVITREHPEWKLESLDEISGKVKHKGENRYDPSNAEFRKWWVKSIMDAIDNEYIDGVFIDALVGYTGTPEQRYASFGKEKFIKVREGAFEMFEDLHKQAMAKGKIVIGNTLRGNPNAISDMGVGCHDYMDGGMTEHFIMKSGDRKEQVAKDISLIQDGAKRGKIIVVKAWPRFDFTQGEIIKSLSDKEKIEILKEDITYPLACFLVGMGKYSYFCYSWGYREYAGGLIDYPEYNKPIGKPLGDAKKDGWVYTRDFENVSVWVDLESKKAKINWK